MGKNRTHCYGCNKELEPHRKLKYSYCQSCHSIDARKYKKKYTDLTPDQKQKEACRSYARKCLRKGILERKPCWECGNEKTEMHHDDYRFPLSVKWLCRLCHAKLHKDHRDKKGLQVIRNKLALLKSST